MSVNLFKLYRDILVDLGVQMHTDTRILDWGCGTGGLVAEGRAAGYDVIGCDFGVELGTNPHLSAIDAANYRLPYPDHSIDIIISNQVLEHVMDYDASLSELRRVLKPGGAFLHMFPARYIPIEPHVFVPGATVIRGRAWLLLWALFGIRNHFQRGMSARARMRTNYAYLRDHTNYLRRNELMRYFGRYFAETRFVEDICLRHHRPAFARLPFAARLYNAFKARVVFGRALQPVNSQSPRGFMYESLAASAVKGWRDQNDNPAREVKSEPVKVKRAGARLCRRPWRLEAGCFSAAKSHSRIHAVYTRQDDP